VLTGVPRYLGGSSPLLRSEGGEPIP
jgi:hypothetical protein